MNVHVVDGTYELFRHFFAVPSVKGAGGQEIGATIGVLGSILAMLRDGATHIGVATDHVIESFRNEMWPGYKSGEGIDPELFSQFPLLEEGLSGLGVVVWPMVEMEADDALASAARKAAADSRVERVFICTPDKDLSQCVSGDHIVQLDRRKREIRNAKAVEAKFGVKPKSIPDYLALVGDSSDGFPGLPGWGAKSTAAVLARYEHLEAIPKLHTAWDLPLRTATRLAAVLDEQWDQALLFRALATLCTDAAVFDSVDDLRWTGPTPDFKSFCARFDATDLLERAQALSGRRG